ncbi:pre-mRNA-splicing factor CWC22 homolog isoform X1 [Dendroctonus ponderosae]|uniref:Female-specific protein transformer n=1 Tax=Dendroctonus ponderosae TaxID=77166 RepID=A0AAR5PT91_DENPD|nr:pre-mRNA-splicing factor CWC22 homolog isoform X1 [Dendroctonus ponderosae]
MFGTFLETNFLQMTRRPSFNTFELKNLHVVISRRKSIECTKNDPLQRNIHDPAKISAHVHHRGLPAKLLFANIQVNQTEPSLRTDIYSERIISSNIEWPRNPQIMTRCTTSQSLRTDDKRRSNSEDRNCRDRRKRRDSSHHRHRRSRSRSDSRSRSRIYRHSKAYRARSISPRRSADMSRKRHRH